MDDMVFQYNNQNSIYVLNSNYSSYGEFARLNLIEPIGVQLGSLPNVDANSHCHHHSSQASRFGAAATGGAGAAGGGCVSVPQNLKYKLKTSGNFNRTASEAIGNPVASSMSAATCSPAAAALQKLFNCSSSVANNMSSCSNIISSSNNANNINRDRDCLSTTEKNNLAADAGALCGNISSSGSSRSNNNSSNINGSSSNNSGGGGGGGVGGGKKKCSNVKSTLIAKKTKFWKFLEEEKLRTSEDSVENVAAATTTTNNCERRSSDHNDSCAPAHSSSACRDRSCVQTPTSSSQFSISGHSLTIEHQQQQQQQQNQQQQHKSNNWSGSHNNSSNSSSNPQQKSSHELYKEAAELLGLSCTLCDNCRCLDCQSGYFDCDDSDSYSEFSLMDEYDEDEDVGTTTTSTTNATGLMMHADNYDDMAAAAATSYSGLRQHKCTDTNCNMADEQDYEDDGDYAETAAPIGVDAAALALKDGVVMARNESDMYGAEVNAVDGAEHDEKQTTRGDPNGGGGSTARLEQSQSNELENCASFNELSLVDAEQQHEKGKCVRQ